MQPFFHNPKDVGARLRKLRKAQRYTQLEMAALLGMSVSSYTKLEIGARNLTPKWVQVVAQRFGVDPSWLLSGEGEAPQESSPEPAVMRETGTLYPQRQERLSADPVCTVREMIEALAVQFGVNADVLEHRLLRAVAAMRKGGMEDVPDPTKLDYLCVRRMVQHRDNTDGSRADRRHDSGGELHG